MSLYLIEGPSQPVVSLADMKEQLRVRHSDYDDMIEALTKEATQRLDGDDGDLGRALMAQTWELRLDGFPCWYVGSGYSRNFRPIYGIEIPLPPLIEVESVKYYDSDNALQTVSADVYEVIGAGGRKPAIIALKSSQSWPASYTSAAAVIVRFRAGYVDTSDSPASGEVPGPIVSAIKLYTELSYSPPPLAADVQRMEMAAKELLKNFRVY